LAHLSKRIFIKKTNNNSFSPYSLSIPKLAGDLSAYSLSLVLQGAP
jgi:hypothetical protein